MFKSKNFLIIIIGIVAVCLTTILVTGCNTQHDPISQDDFIAKAKSAGYTCKDYGSDIKNLTGLAIYNRSAIKSAALASNNDSSNLLCIEFWQLDNADTAAEFFEANQEKIDSQNGTSFSTSSGNYKNHDRKTDAVYFKIVQVDNTFIYAYSDLNKKDELNSFINSIGY